jgi:acyl-[acyl-carrier-protein]-phospholipid O-acyltransferase/long-chain-fatty-acid--[acyl-carrier-protein] ligase
MIEWYEVVLWLLGAFAGCLALTWLFPPLLRPFLWAFMHACYRFRAYHPERIPTSGGVLIVSNHVSRLDWLVYWVACPRPVLFVTWSGYYRNPLLRFFLSWARHRTIRVDSRPLRPHAVGDSLKVAAEALDAGNVVVMFPEGRLSRTGQMLPFRRGVERILKHTTTNVAVVPACTSGLWGGFFSHGGGPILRKRPKALRPRVCVYFGEAVKNPTPLFPPLSRGPLLAAPPPEGEGRKTKAVASSPPPPEGEGAGGWGSADFRLAVQECTADLAILESRYLLTVHRRFVRVAAKFRRLFRPAVTDYSGGTPRTLNWAKLLVGAICVTRYLRPRVGDAPNVGIWLPTGLGGALANVGLAFLGKASVNLNYTAGTAAVRSAVQQAGVRTVITAKRFTARVPLDLPDDVQLIHLEDALAAVTKWERLRTFLAVLLAPGWLLDRWLGLHRHRLDDPLTIIFSSGSTGEPKGIVLTHRNIAANVDSAIRTLEVAPGDTIFGILPFFHSFGYTVCMWLALDTPCPAVYFPDPRQAKEVGEIARANRVTLMAATATFLRFYIRRCGADDFRTLRLIVCGAEKLPVKLQEEFRDKFGVLPLEGYGCTELSPVVSCSMPDVDVGGMIQQRNRPGCIGQPIFGVCVRARDPQTEEPLPVGAEGVLWVKGPNVMGGYLHQPERTATVLKDGWYNTGDAGLVEPDGFVRITGRVSRFAKIAGEMVPLERLDDEMHEALATGGDRVLAVSAVPDEKRGERVVVLYLPEIEPRLPELLAALPKRGIPNLWVPDRRDCYPVDAMPVLGTGKLDLKKLGDLAKRLAGGV